jgi:hypothetical protein
MASLRSSLARFWTNLPFLWKFQIIFWPIYALGSAPISIVGLRYAALWNMSFGGLVVFLLLDDLYFFLNTLLIGKILNRPFFRRLRMPGLALSVLLLVSTSVAFVIFVAGPYAFRSLVANLSTAPPIAAAPGTPLKRVTARVYNFMFLGSWSAVYLIARSSWESRNRERLLELAESKRRHAELLMLRSQINPHFLFNAMNSIANEAGGNEKLDHIVSGLSDYLRYSLANRSNPFVPFEEEMHATSCFIDLEQSRLGDKLHVELDIDPASLRIPVPGILLQPLVENAIKYGLLTSSLPVRLRIATRCAGNRLAIEVANTGTWIGENESSSRSTGGVGLANVRERLALFYPETHRLSTTADNGWVTLRIEIDLPNR